MPLVELLSVIYPSHDWDLSKFSKSGSKTQKLKNYLQTIFPEKSKYY
jgi:hypothetical protein